MSHFRAVEQRIKEEADARLSWPSSSSAAPRFLSLIATRPQGTLAKDLLPSSLSTRFRRINSHRLKSLSFARDHRSSSSTSEVWDHRLLHDRLLLIVRLLPVHRLRSRSLLARRLLVLHLLVLPPRLYPLHVLDQPPPQPCLRQPRTRFPRLPPPPLTRLPLPPAPATPSAPARATAATLTTPSATTIPTRPSTTLTTTSPSTTTTPTTRTAASVTLSPCPVSPAPPTDPSETSSRVPLTTTASSRTPASWSVSSLTLRPKFTSRLGSEVTSSLAYTRLARKQETKIGDLQVEVEVVCEIIRMKCLSGDGDYISVCIERLVWNFRVAGPKGRVGGSLTITAINLD
ncbi:hypothetical protein BDP55DRAFT_397646 [Colletotrichum godetiae]|uniref:Uncharacterized protein n=1 Tax=Colletotrichum godetiae TaxID=1209918 RepID=A0AAJ0EPE2_9PEZI|nr:uncharacterized protein BDP55DRAFT_397646 [Colletotrichum godetiae]KAK1658487.1 hypothetical protein BDP55DRAFT_397646 [Colletotrichum godetiae]